MRKLLVALATFLCYAGPLLAQKTVTGRVTDDTGQPIPNATVQVKGTGIGTTTKEDGTFTLTVPANGNELEISTIGKAAQTVAIGNQNSFNVSLLPATASLD